MKRTLILLLLLSSPLITLAQQAEPDEALIWRLDREVLDILKKHPGRSARHPLKAKLANHSPALQVRVLMPLITYGANAENRSTQQAVSIHLAELWEESWPHLVKALDDESTDRRLAATVTIEELRSKSQGHEHHPWMKPAGPKLARLLREDPSAVVRVEAARALASFDEKAAPFADDILAAIDDPDDRVANMALDVISDIGPDGWRAIPRLIEIINKPKGRYDRDIAARALQHMGYAAREALPHLLRACADKSAVDMHNNASSAIWWIRPQGFSSVPADLLADAIRNCGKSGPVWMAYITKPKDPRVAAALAELLESIGEHDDHVGHWVVRALGAIKPNSPALISRLRDLAESDRPFARVWAAAAYAKASGDLVTTLPVMKRALKKGGDERNAAVQALRSFGKAARPLLSHISPNTTSDNPWTPLHEINTHHQVRGQPDKYVEYVAGLLKHRSTNDFGEHAARVLFPLGPMCETHTPAVIAAMSDYSSHAQRNRFQAARVIRHIGPTAQTRDAMKQLKRMLDSKVEPSPYNRRMASEAIWSVSRDAKLATDGLLGTLDDRGNNFFWAMWALQNMSAAAKPALPRLRQIMRDDQNPHFRKVAADTITHIEAAEFSSVYVQPDQAHYDRWFEQLGDEDDQIAVEAIWRFTRATEAFRARAGLAPNDELDRLVTQLDHDNWGMREIATKAIQETLPDSSYHLHERLRQSKSLEVKVRLRRLLGNMRIKKYPHDTLRMNRQHARVLQTDALIEHLATP